MSVIATIRTVRDQSEFMSAVESTLSVAFATRSSDVGTQEVARSKYDEWYRWSAYISPFYRRGSKLGS
jgi:hypothetical protein